MEIFYTGGGGRRLLTIFQPGATDKPRETAIIICHPLGHEYIRYYKTVAVLAKKLAGEGFNTLRFDYFGTGDSYGNEEDLSIDTARLDLAEMIVEVKEATGCRRICLIGIRFGGLVCSSMLQAPGVCAVVLWNPVLSGEAFLEDLRQQHQAQMAGSFAKARPGGRSRPATGSPPAAGSRPAAGPRPAAGFEALGFTYGAGFAQSDHAELTIPDQLPAFILADGHSFDSYNYPLLETAANEVGAFWIKNKGDRDKSMVPVNDIEKIISWVKSKQNYIF